MSPTMPASPVMRLMCLALLALGAALPGRAADADRGAQQFPQCAACHGPGGEGTSNGSVPRIAGQHESVLRKQLMDFRQGVRRNFRMSELADRHHLETSQDVADVAAYTSRLEARGTGGTSDGFHASAGALLFGARCASCHGADGRGNATRIVPRLAGQHYSYLVRQMYDAVDGRRSTLAGLHANKIQPLDYDQVRAIADYLSRIDPSTLSPASQEKSR